METMKSDLVKPPGTPVCVGTTPPVTVTEAGNSHSVDCSSGECVLCVPPLSERPPLKEESQCCFLRTITKDMRTQVV